MGYVQHIRKIDSVLILTTSVCIELNKNLNLNSLFSMEDIFLFYKYLNEEKKSMCTKIFIKKLKLN